MDPRRIVVLGGGFAGLWSAVAAARQREQLGYSAQELPITLVNRDAYHSIRVRNYEADLSQVRVPLDDVLGPIEVDRVAGDVTRIDLSRRQIEVSQSDDPRTRSLPYDRLIFALGSQLVRPQIPGWHDFGFDVDTYDAAQRLEAHLQSLPHQPDTPGKYTVLVVGAGLTGIETATAMPARLQALAKTAAAAPSWRVILADHSAQVGSDMGESARQIIEPALKDLGVETLTGCSVTAIDADGATLADGRRILAATIVWCAGLRASPLVEQFPVQRDRWGRLSVDDFLRVKGVPGVFAAGDVASVLVDDTHHSAMSCQHGRPMGRFAGHNAVCDLLGQPMLPLRIDWYVTVLDLGPAGAVYTEGWDRHVVATGSTAKRTKQIINCQRIYPPPGGDRRAILAAGAPEVQAPPDYGASLGAQAQP